MSSGDVFTTTDADQSLVRSSINEAVQELCMLTGTYRKTVLVPLYADQGFYRLGFQGDHFGWVVEAWDRERKYRLTQTSARKLYENDPDFMSRTGYAEEYFQIGHDMLGIFRKPSATGTVLELTCVMIPKAYTYADEEIKLRKVYETAAVYLATSDFYASQGNANRATEYLQRYMETANLMALHPRAPEEVPVMKGGK